MVEVVSDLVQSYIRRPRTLILTVVSAQSDGALQSVLKRAKAFDPHVKRTIGLITNPDTLPRVSESEKYYFKLAMNEITRFRLDWHVLMSRHYDTRNISSVERDRREEEFFADRVWKTLPRGLSAQCSKCSSLFSSNVVVSP